MEIGKIYRILILEDKAADIELLKRELNKSDFNYISKEVSSKTDFLESLITFSPDIILADYFLPMFNGMHAFKLFKEQNISIPFILVTGTLSEQLAMECLQEGVDDFILKSGYNLIPLVICRNLQIKEAQRNSERIALELEKRNDELRILRENITKVKTYELLSRREFDVLCLIATGNSIKEIAQQLFLSPATVATYRARLLEKLDLKSNVDLTRYAISNKLVDKN
jgi:DNA-binding NarL/FixJ family response regulator